MISKSTKARIIYTDGREKPVIPDDKEEGFTLEELKKLLEIGEDSLIQSVPMESTGMILLVDEEGMMKDLPKNDLATMACALDVHMGDKGIQGNAIICPADWLQ